MDVNVYNRNGLRSSLGSEIFERHSERHVFITFMEATAATLKFYVRVEVSTEELVQMFVEKMCCDLRAPCDGKNDDNPK